MFLQAIDRTSPCGLRDYAIFLLMTTYGLRRCDIVALTLDDVAWRDRGLRIRQRKNSTAVHLLKAGVDIVTISQWLGHASVATTNRYATIDLEMKRKAIEQARPINHTTSELACWRTDTSILTWLEAL